MEFKSGSSGQKNCLFLALAIASILTLSLSAFAAADVAYTTKTLTLQSNVMVGPYKLKLDSTTSGGGPDRAIIFVLDQSGTKIDQATLSDPALAGIYNEPTSKNFPNLAFSIELLAVHAGQADIKIGSYLPVTDSSASSSPSPSPTATQQTGSSSLIRSLSAKYPILIGQYKITLDSLTAGGGPNRVYIGVYQSGTKIDQATLSDPALAGIYNEPTSKNFPNLGFSLELLNERNDPTDGWLADLKITTYLPVSQPNAPVSYPGGTVPLPTPTPTQQPQSNPSPSTSPSPSASASPSTSPSPTSTATPTPVPGSGGTSASSSSGGPRGAQGGDGGGETRSAPSIASASTPTPEPTQDPNIILTSTLSSLGPFTDASPVTVNMPLIISQRGLVSLVIKVTATIADADSKIDIKMFKNIPTIDDKNQPTIPLPAEYIKTFKTFQITPAVGLRDKISSAQIVYSLTGNELSVFAAQPSASQNGTNPNASTVNSSATNQSSSSPDSNQSTATQSAVIPISNISGVVLLRFADGKWNELPTTFEQAKADGSVQFTSTTPGFSVFVVAMKNTPFPSPSPVVLPSATPTPSSEKSSATGLITAGNSGLVYGAAFLVILLIVGGVWYAKKGDSQGGSESTADPTQPDPAGPENPSPTAPVATELSSPTTPSPESDYVQYGTQEAEKKASKAAQPTTEKKANQVQLSVPALSEISKKLTILMDEVSKLQKAEMKRQQSLKG